MKTHSITHMALLIGALSAASLSSSFAQDQPSAPAAAKPQSALTADEKAQLKKDTDQVLAANPDLKTQGDDLKKQREALGSGASDSDKQALHAKMHDFHAKEHAAIVKIDPSASVIFAKLEAAHKARSQTAAQ